MKLILGIYDYSVILYSYMSLLVDELLPFDRLNINEFNICLWGYCAWLGKYCPASKFQWKMLALQILQKSLKWQRLAFMNAIK